MQETFISDTNHRIKEKIHLVLNSLNPNASDYIKDILVLVNKDIGLNKILSILIFGSQRPGKNNENSTVSDCDLLIIFKDWVSNRNLREIERRFMSLEIKHGFAQLGKTFLEKVMIVVQRTTGMFVSHFLTKKHYWQHAVFHKIFKVNKYFSSAVAPKNIVLSSAIDNSTLLYGEDLRSIKDSIEIPHFDMIKSAAMNFILSLSSLAISPLKRLNSIKFSLEAVKWALKASNYYSFEDSPSTEHIVKRFVYLEKYKGSKRRAKIFYNRFLRLRQDPKLDLGFMLRCPFRVLKIHIKGILYYKILENLKVKKA